MAVEEKEKPSFKEIWHSGFGPVTGREYIILYLKGFIMGIADLIPGVSGGTVAFVSGIYENLLESISSFNRDFVAKFLKGDFRAALCDVRLRFLIPLLGGILTAMFSLARLMHYLISEHPIPTWALFFGLIAASILILAREIPNLFSLKMISLIAVGTAIAYVVVSLIPVETPDDWWFIILSGMISICAMILPGISGSFLLLILGKYAYITGALKNPFAPGAFEIMILFVLGAGTGILGFSKILNWAFKHYRAAMMALLTGFLIGSMKKVWPWKVVTNSLVVRGETKVIQEANILPLDYGAQFWLALGLAVAGLVAVLVLESLSKAHDRAKV